MSLHIVLRRALREISQRCDFVHAETLRPAGEILFEEFVERIFDDVTVCPFKRFAVRADEVLSEEMC